MRLHFALKVVSQIDLAQVASSQTATLSGCSIQRYLSFFYAKIKFVNLLYNKEKICQVKFANIFKKWNEDLIFMKWATVIAHEMQDYFLRTPCMKCNLQANYIIVAQIFLSKNCQLNVYFFMNTKTYKYFGKFIICPTIMQSRLHFMIF